MDAFGIPCYCISVFRLAKGIFPILLHTDDKVILSHSELGLTVYCREEQLTNFQKSQILVCIKNFFKHSQYIKQRRFFEYLGIVFQLIGLWKAQLVHALETAQRTASATVRLFF